MTREEARRIAVNIAKLPDLLISKPGIVEQDVANDQKTAPSIIRAPGQSQSYRGDLLADAPRQRQTAPPAVLFSPAP